jgi:stage IV sporulation protein A
LRLRAPERAPGNLHRAGKGEIEYTLTPVDDLFYKVRASPAAGDQERLSPDVHAEGPDEFGGEYERAAAALKSVRAAGYAMIPPTWPTDPRRAGADPARQPIRRALRAAAFAALDPGGRDCEVSPLIGTEGQAAELVKLLMKIRFGRRKLEHEHLRKSLHDLVSEGLNGKLTRMSEDARKAAETLTRI